MINLQNIFGLKS